MSNKESLNKSENIIIINSILSFINKLSLPMNIIKVTEIKLWYTDILLI
ncbi:hypothetical protein GNF80_14270 [Clostridium perfringens]|nr:hypothetical protein [Clostridium perfringens]